VLIFGINLWWNPAQFGMSGFETTETVYEDDPPDPDIALREADPPDLDKGFEVDPPDPDYTR
jgi:hypothetical protein